MKKNITLSAEESLLKKARERAREEHSSLNEAFRSWLRSYASVHEAARGYDQLMGELRHVDSGRPFTRDELNER